MGLEAICNVRYDTYGRYDLKELETRLNVRIGVKIGGIYGCWSELLQRGRRCSGS